MKAGELFVDSEAKKAAFTYAWEVCEYQDEIEAIVDAFIAGVAWKQFKDEVKITEVREDLAPISFLGEENGKLDRDNS